MKNLGLDLRSVALLLNQGETLQHAWEKVGQRPGSQAWLPCAESLASGSPLAEALLGVSGLPDCLHGWLHEGLGDKLPGALEQAAQLLEDRQRQSRLWRTLLIYPVILLVAVLLNTLLISFISVQIQRALVPLDGGVPALVAIIRAVSGFFLASAPLLGLLPFGLWLLLRLPAVRLRLPVVGNIFRLREAILLFRWLELSMQSQSSLPDGFRRARLGCTAAPLQAQLVRLTQRLEEGSSLSDALSHVSSLPAPAVWLLMQADRRQFEPGSLTRMADVLEKTLEFQLAFGWTLFYLALYIFSGLMALWLMGALFLPILTAMALA